MAKLNKSTSTSSKMKASGARYSTTSRSGKQTFYSSSKAAESGKENAIGTSTRESTSVIPMNAMQNTPVANIPPKPVPSDIGGINLSADPSMANMGFSVQNNQYVYDPKKSETENALAQADSQGQSTLQSVLSFIGKPQDKSSEFARLEKRAGISDLQNQVGNYTSELNQIVAKQQQDLLNVRGQGSTGGVTEAVYGGQQATINREAAIRALPVQAALSAAQGNLEMAQQRVNQLFALKSADMDAQYKYKQDVGNAVLQFANQSQARTLNAKLSEIQEEKNLAKENLNYLRDLTNTAIQNGRTGAISQLASIDPKSPTFNQDVARIAGGLVKPVGDGKRDTQFDPNGNLVDMQTGEIISPAGGNTQPDQVQKSLDQISFLQTTIKDAKSLADATGPNMITKGFGNVFVGNTRVKQLANKIDTLKTNLLTLNSDPALKKFFGPQMTEKDTQLLMSAGSTLNAYDATEADNKAELERYEELLNRMQTAIQQGGGNAFGIVLTGADGLQYTITD